MYGNEFLLHAQVFEWFESFQGGREEVEDDSRPDRRSTSKPGDSTEKIGHLVRSSYRLSTIPIAETVWTDK